MSARKQSTSRAFVLETGLVRLSLDELRPSPENQVIYRDTEQSLKDFAAHIMAEGVLEPLVITADNYILSGHRRHAAANIAGLDSVPCRRLQFKRADMPTDKYVALLREFNRQRSKSIDEIIRGSGGGETRSRATPILQSACAEIANNMNIHDQDPKAISTHEAAHVVVALALGLGVDRVEIVPAADGSAGRWFYQPFGPEKAESMILATYAGLAAETLFDPSTSPGGATGDDAMAREIFRWDIKGPDKEAWLEQKRVEAADLVARLWPIITTLAKQLRGRKIMTGEKVAAIVLPMLADMGVKPGELVARPLHGSTSGDNPGAAVQHDSTAGQSVLAADKGILANGLDNR